MTPEIDPLRAVAVLRGSARPDFLRDELLHEIFETTVAGHPNHPALRCHGETVSYGQLDVRSIQLAHHLRSLGVQPRDRVVVWMPRGIEMYVAMLAILRSGATYVPLDADYPVERIRYVVEDCGARFIVTAPILAIAAATLPCASVIPQHEHARIAIQPRSRLARAETAIRSDDGAYLLYTSGSTGRPKGVLVPHRAICHFVRAEGSVLGLASDDLVFQGASLSFDMSLEEIWPAWAAGATLLVGTAEVMRTGGDLAALLAREGVTAWTCVPTLLSLQEQRIPTLRLLNLGGEACPPELVRAWAGPGLRMLNTYGPTEATITATYAEIGPDAPVTIGRPLPNYSAYVMAEAGGDGRVGELYIGGPGLAQGYFGRPDLTAERFVPNPFPGSDDKVLYRTGDRVRLTDAGMLEFLGRIDTQVKIRGHRVELSEIESVLLGCDGLKQAAVALHRDPAGGDMLVAYVVPRGGLELDDSKIRAALRQRLPAYMIPSLIERLSTLPTLASGKVDRKRLPVPSNSARPSRPGTSPATETERKLLAECGTLFAPSVVSAGDDFFRELGGHSLLAAAYVSALRKDPGLRHVSMADVYHFPTVRKLAAHLDATRPAPARARSTVPAAISRVRFFGCAVAQAAGLVLVYGLFSLQWLIPYLSYAWLYDTEGFERPTAIAISLSLFLVAIPVMLVAGIVAKWLILGRLRPGEYPLWGFTYYRWWLTQRLLDTVPIEYLGRSPLLGLYYRLLGARIGHGVLLDSVPIDAPDCVVIGDNVSFGAGASLCCCKVEDGKLKVGEIQVGQDCLVGATTVVARNTKIGDRAELGDLSLLPEGQSIPPGEKWAGSPARRVGTTNLGPPSGVSAARRRAFGVVHAGLLFVFPLFAILPIFPGMMLMTELDQNTDAYGFVLLSPVLAIVFLVAMCLQIAALKWLLVGKVKPGRVPVCSFAYVRHWLTDQLMRLSLDVANPLYATLYLNPWYRLLGVRLRPRAEVSTASSISYDLLEVGEESFIADAVSLGAPRIEGGTLRLERTTIGRRAFVGNSAVIPAGTDLGDGVLVGVLSVPPSEPADAKREGSSWFGTPAVFLPQRQIAAQFDEGSTFRPRRHLVAQRLVIEFCRVILPLTVMIALTSLLMSYVVDLDDADWSVTQIALVFPFLYIGYALAAAVFVLALKWAVVGRYRPVEKPLWNQFVWRSELVTSTYENLAVPLFADQLRGTPFLAMYLRWLGAKIGRRVYLDTTDVTEFDLVRIGDEAALNDDYGPQTHLFEDRVMKIARVDIGARCVIGASSIVLYDTRMEEGSALGELSMLMKGETLPAGTRWEGSPARPVEAGG